VIRGGRIERGGSPYVAETVADGTARKVRAASVVDWDDTNAERRSSAECSPETSVIFYSNKGKGKAVTARDDGADRRGPGPAGADDVRRMDSRCRPGPRDVEPNNGSVGRMARRNGRASKWGEHRIATTFRDCLIRQPGASTRTRSKFTSRSPGGRSGSIQALERDPNDRGGARSERDRVQSTRSKCSRCARRISKDGPLTARWLWQRCPRRGRRRGGGDGINTTRSCRSRRRRTCRSSSRRDGSPNGVELFTTDRRPLTPVPHREFQKLRVVLSFLFFCHICFYLYVWSYFFGAGTMVWALGAKLTTRKFCARIGESTELAMQSGRDKLDCGADLSATGRETCTFSKSSGPDGPGWGHATPGGVTAPWD